MLTIAQALEVAIDHHRAGRLDAAGAIYEQILAAEPQEADALNLLGRVELARGHAERAADLFRSALAVDPAPPAVHVSLGEALQALGKLDEAESAYRAALRLQTTDLPALRHLASLFETRGDLPQAEAFYRQAVQAHPRSAAAHNDLGSLLRKRNRCAEAKACYQSALALEPQLAVVHNNLGNVFRQEKQFPQAIEAYRKALTFDPSFALAHYNLGIALRQSGQLAEALEAFRHAARLRPSDFEAVTNVAALCNELGKTEEAIAVCRQAVELHPANDVALSNLGVFLMLQGRLDEAIDCYRRAVEAAPEKADQHGNLLYALNYHPSLSPPKVFAEHRAWGERHADPLTAQARPHTNQRATKPRLRIGYVSPYFRAHAVNFFTEPILAHHDHDQFEIFCYSDTVPVDSTTRRLQGYADTWRDIVGLADQAVSELVRSDEIDILVDLTGHIAGSRLLTFARRPAPVQATYIGYQNTTGMQAMDYRLTDAWSDPPGKTEAWHTEELVRLPRSFFCYLPSDDAPPVTTLPALTNGFVTFGSLNSLAKVNPGVLATWARILLAVPNSRLMLLGPLTDYLRDYFPRVFAALDVAGGRIKLCDRRPRAEYLELIQRIDIALDPFPFNGHTTTCDVLWQGLPVVTLAGNTYASRFGSSALVTLGCQQWIADSPDAYVEIAVRLASDLPHLSELRAQLRPRMACSPLLDFRGFTANLEATYREMWRKWCDGGR